jgi:hypothetical protein
MGSSGWYTLQDSPGNAMIAPDRVVQMRICDGINSPLLMIEQIPQLDGASARSARYGNTFFFF